MNDAPTKSPFRRVRFLSAPWRKDSHDHHDNDDKEIATETTAPTTEFHSGKTRSNTAMASGDRNPVRDRTLILRVLVPSLEARLREKLKEAEEQAASETAGKNPTDFLTRETLYDLDGVLCEPTHDGSTRWNFHCDGAKYPGKQVIYVYTCLGASGGGREH